MANKNKVTWIEFVFIIWTMTCAGPYGFEYTVKGIGIGYTLMLILFFCTIYAFPMAMIVCEFGSMMPSNHGSILWSYRAFHNINPKIADFIGFISAINLITYITLGAAACPIVFSSYIETVTGDLPYLMTYLIRFLVILSGVVLNIGHFSTLALIMTILIIACFIPMLIGVCWTLPKINPSEQWTGCAPMNWSLAIATCIWEFCVYEGLASLIGEIKFSTTKLASAFIVAICIAMLSLLLPITSAATQSSDCNDWFDGYQAHAYKDISMVLFYSYIVVGCVFAWTYYVPAVGVISRMIWAISQPHFTVLSDGRMLIEGSNSEIESDIVEQEEMSSNQRRIPIAILPKRWMGNLWDRTGSPVVAVVVMSALMAMLNFYLSFSTMIEFAIFAYFISFGCEMAAYMVLKYREPHAPRPYKVPFGKIGAWIATIILSCAMGLCFCVLVINEWNLFLYALVYNAFLVCYYFVSKRYGNCCVDRKRYHECNDEDTSDASMVELNSGQSQSKITKLLRLYSEAIIAKYDMAVNVST